METAPFAAGKIAELYNFCEKRTIIMIAENLERMRKKGVIFSLEKELMCG